MSKPDKPESSEPKPPVFTTRITSYAEVSVTPALAAGKHTLYIGAATCSLNLFKANAMTQSHFDIEDLERLRDLFTRAIAEQQRAKEIEVTANKS